MQLVDKRKIAFLLRHNQNMSELAMLPSAPNLSQSSNLLCLPHMAIAAGSALVHGMRAGQ